MPNPQSPSANPLDPATDTLATETLAPETTATPKDNAEQATHGQKDVKKKTKPSTTKKPLEKLKKAKPAKAETPSPTEFMATEYKGVSIYAMAMAILIALILWTGIATVQQVQAYHQQYGNLQQLKKDYRKLQIENQRLLIEQQTFSATPQIASRAVAELNMFYPQLSDRMIIQADSIATKPTNLSNTATATAHATPTNQNSGAKTTPNTPTAQTDNLQENTEIANSQIANSQIENSHIENAPIGHEKVANVPQIDNSAEYDAEQAQDGQGTKP